MFMKNHNIEDFIQHCKLTAHFKKLLIKKYAIEIKKFTVWED